MSYCIIYSRSSKCTFWKLIYKNCLVTCFTFVFYLFYLPIKLGIVPEVFHSVLDSYLLILLLLLGGLLDESLLPPEEGGDTGQIGDGVEVEVNGILLVDDDEEEEGEIDKFNIEWAMLVWEFDGRMIETGVEEGGGGGERDPNLWE